MQSSLSRTEQEKNHVTRESGAASTEGIDVRKVAATNATNAINVFNRTYGSTI
jgi:hypothetical protein